MLSHITEVNNSSRLNGEKQAHITGNGAGNNHANNNIDSNNHNGYYTINLVIGTSIPPPTKHEISRAPTEPLNAIQVPCQAKRGWREIPALHYAAEVGDETEVERILKVWSVESLMSRRTRGVGEKDKQRGMNPLHYAAKRGNQTIVRLILSYQAERELLEFYSRTGQGRGQPPKNAPQTAPPIEPEDTVKSLLASKSKEHGRDALHYAAAAGHDDVARVLLEFGADIKAKCSRAGMNSMHYAAEFGHVNILSLLKSHLDSPADITDKPDSLKRNRRKKNSHKLPMGKHSPSPAPRENIADSVSDAQPNEWKTVQSKRDRRRRHLKPNREVNPKQKATLNDMLKIKSKMYGLTPLHFAAGNGRNTAAEFLIGCGANIEAKCTWNGMEAIHYAAKHGHVTTTRLLCGHSADINAVSGRERMAPLHYAAQMGHEAVVKFLCDNNADFTSRCRWSQMTPLHFAAKHGHEVVVRMLVLYHQPSTLLKDKDRRTAIQYAEENGSESIRHFLNHYPRG